MAFVKLELSDTPTFREDCELYVREDSIIKLEYEKIPSGKAYFIVETILKERHHVSEDCFNRIKRQLFDGETSPLKGNPSIGLQPELL